MPEHATLGGTATLSPAADTALLQWQPGYNLGAQEDLPAGGLGATLAGAPCRILLRFDLAAGLPAGARIDSAILELSVTRFPDGGGVNSVFGLHRVLRAWAEGSGKGSSPGGSAAQNGEATWNAAREGEASWATPGGLAGVDYVAEPSSTERILQLGRYTFEFGANQLAELQSWLTNPEQNHGWMLISQSEGTATTARRFGAREHPSQETRPRLVLGYSVPTTIEPPKIASLALDEGMARVLFEAGADVQYWLEASPDPALGPWVTVAGSVRTNHAGMLVLADPDDPRDRRFYRVRATP